LKLVSCDEADRPVAWFGQIEIAQNAMDAQAEVVKGEWKPMVWKSKDKRNGTELRC